MSLAISASISRLGVVGELEPVGAEQLDAVVLVGLCEAEIITPRSARRLRVSMAIAGVGNGPTSGTSMPDAVNPRERRLDHVAGQPRVLADHHAMAMAAAEEQQAGRLAQPQRHLGGHRIGVRVPRMPSVPKSRTCHRLSALCAAAFSQRLITQAPTYAHRLPIRTMPSCGSDDRHFTSRLRRLHQLITDRR